MGRSRSPLSPRPGAGRPAGPAVREEVPRGFSSRHGPAVVAAAGAGARRGRSRGKLGGEPGGAGRWPGGRWPAGRSRGGGAESGAPSAPPPRRPRGLVKGAPSESPQCPPAARVEGPEWGASREAAESRPPGGLAGGFRACLRALNVHPNPRVQLLQTESLISSSDPRLLLRVPRAPL